MARTGIVDGMYFDSNIFTEYMQEKSYVKDAIIASGILRVDPAIRNAIGANGNVGTIPLFAPIDDTDSALNFDGATNNTPTAISGKKQSFMKIGRMKAWKDSDFTRYLTGVSPVQNMADNLVVPYWQNQWQKALLATLKGVMGVAGLATHVTDISTTSGSIADSNKIGATSLIELGQKAIGDMAGNLRLALMHSTVYARYQALGLVEFNKYSVPNAIQNEINLPTINGKIVVVDDSLVDTSVSDFPVYSTYLVGVGAILSDTFEVPNPYYMDYDPETSGGITKLYTKQAMVLHPNGMSIAFDSIAKDSPTNTELATSGNWSLAYNAKNVEIALIKTNG